jgi:beta-glucuronidase
MTYKLLTLSLLLTLLSPVAAAITPPSTVVAAAPSSPGAQPAMTNVYGRRYQSLNGKWNILIDRYDAGLDRGIPQNRKPQGKTDFYEFSFDGAPRLDVPGDWNSQLPELKYYEGTVWYARHFRPQSIDQQPTLSQPPTLSGHRHFLYFAGVNYRCRIYLNGVEIGSHEGGFTPFQIEVTGKLLPDDNFLAVEVNNRRSADAIPALNYDW